MVMVLCYKAMEVGLKDNGIRVIFSNRKYHKIFELKRAKLI
jgi:hypothetical protein